MKRVSLLALLVLASASLSGCSLESIAASAPAKAGMEQQDEKVDEGKAVAKLVKEFGTKLKLVSLLAPKDIVSKSMQENYGNYVSGTLLEKWRNDPQHAPGRTVSSPWPERIEIGSVEKLSANAYQAKGEIIEVTSTDLEKGTVSNKQPITLTVKKIDNRWLIDDVKLGTDEKAESVAYVNNEYGFKFSLPESWEGYSIVTDKWEGSAPESSQSETGPTIKIRHPRWKTEEPRQDIPVMVLTVAQWDALQQGKFHIGAAPVGPSELGRNSKYVFALPARYNFAFPKGFEEVEQILSNEPLEPIERK